MNYDDMTDKEIQEKIDEIDYKIYDIEQDVQELSDERNELANTIESRKNSKFINGDLLNLTKWILQSVTKNLIVLKSSSGLFQPPELFEFSGGLRHNDIYFLNNCQLSFDDGELFLKLMMDSNNAVKLIKSWNLTVITSMLKRQIEKTLEIYNHKINIINLIDDRS